MTSASFLRNLDFIRCYQELHDNLDETEVHSASVKITSQENSFSSSEGSEIKFFQSGILDQEKQINDENSQYLFGNFPENLNSSLTSEAVQNRNLEQLNILEVDLLVVSNVFST